MTVLADFLTLTRGHLKGCPDLLMEEAVRESAIEFCRRTQLIINDVTVRVKSGRRFYEMYPPDGLAWVVDKVLRDTRPLDSSDRREFEDDGLDVDSGTASAYYIEGDGRLTLGPIPDADETLTAKVTIRPEEGATEVPDILYTEWREAIAAGAKIYGRKHYEQWYDPDRQNREEVVFEDAISKANLRRAKGGGKKPLRVTAHFQ